MNARSSSARLLAAVAALAVVGGLGITAGPAARAVTQLSVTSGDCKGAGSITEAVLDANTRPNEQTIISIDVAQIDFSTCNIGYDRALRIEAPIEFKGNNNSFVAKNMWVTSSGSVQPDGKRLKCPTKTSSIVSIAPQLFRIDGKVQVKFSDLTMRGLSGFGLIAGGADVILDKVTASEFYGFDGRDCAYPIIEVVDNSNLTILNTRWVTMANDRGNVYGPMLSPLILGSPGGSLKISESIFESYTAGSTINWIGGDPNSEVTIVSSRFTDSETRGIRTGGTTGLTMINSLISPGSEVVSDTSDNTAIVLEGSGPVEIKSSTLQFTNAEMLTLFPPGDPNIPEALFVPAQNTFLWDTAIDVLDPDLGVPEATKVLGGDPGDYQWVESWVQPVLKQDDTAIKAFDPYILTGEPGFLSFAEAVGKSTQIVSTPAPGGPLIGAIKFPDRLTNPVTNQEITKDVWGNPRTVNGERSIGAVEPTRIPTVNAYPDYYKSGAIKTFWGGASVDFDKLEGFTLQWTEATDTNWDKVQEQRLPKTESYYEVTGLPGGVQYKFRVLAKYSDGLLEVSNVALATPLKRVSDPTITVVPGQTSDSLKVTWTEPDWGSYPDDHRYLLQYRLKQSPAGAWVNAGWFTPREATISALKPGGSYEVKVQAEGTFQTFYHDLSPCDVTVTPKPACVTSAQTKNFPALTVRASPGDGQVALQWIKPVDDTSITDYTITISDLTNPSKTKKVTCSTLSCSTTIDSLVNGTTYSFNVAASGVGPGVTYETPAAPAPAPQTPTLTYAPVSTPAGVPIRMLPATAPAGASGTFAVRGGLESWMTLDATSGRIEGTPPASSIGRSYSVQVEWTVGYGTASGTADITVTGNAPKLSYPDVASHVGETISMTPKVSTIAQPVAGTYSLTKGTLPAGLSFDTSTGVISGVATTATSGPVTLTASYSDASGTATDEFSIDVSSQVAVLSAAYPNIRGHVGQPVTATPTVTGAKGTLSYSLASGALPAGLSLDASTGVISGTPTAPVATPVAVTVRVFDGASAVVVGLNITVDPHTFDVTYPNTVTDVRASTGVSPTAIHALGQLSFAVTKGTLPAGLSLIRSSGSIIGVPTSATNGPVSIEVTATDKYASATASFTITVNPVVTPAQATAIAVRDGEVVIALGKTWGVTPGTMMTPMVRLSGQSTFVGGAPVEVLADGEFVWTRFVRPTKAISVYFVTAGGVQTAHSDLGKASITVAKDGRANGRVKVTGSVEQLAVGQDVYPMVRIDGAKAVQGIPVTVRDDGTFTWSRKLRSGSSMTVVFESQNVRSNKLSWG